MKTITRLQCAFVAGILALLIAPIQAVAAESAEYRIAKKAEYHEWIRIPHGSGALQAGLKRHTYGTGHGGKIGIASFRVKDGVFYLLDNVNKKILVIDKEKNLSPIPLRESTWYEDLECSDHHTIYLLTGESVVEIDMQGKILLESPLPYQLPFRFEPSSDGRLIVNTYEGARAVWEDRVVVPTVQATQVIGDETGGTITTTYRGEKVQVPYRYEFGAGGLEVLQTHDNRLLIAKTEISNVTSRVLAETQIMLIDTKGAELGSIRVPTEKMITAPKILVQTENKRIFLLSIEDDATILYECTLGENPESILQRRIDRQLMMEKIENRVRELQRTRIPKFFYWN